MPIPRDQLPIGEGLFPNGDSGATFFIDLAELEMLEQDGPEWKLDDGRFIKEAIREPDVILQGLMHSGQDEGLAYAVRPTRDPDDESSNPLPPRFGYTLLCLRERE